MNLWVIVSTTRLLLWGYCLFLSATKFTILRVLLYVGSHTFLSFAMCHVWLFFWITFNPSHWLRADLQFKTHAWASWGFKVSGWGAIFSHVYGEDSLLQVYLFCHGSDSANLPRHGTSLVVLGSRLCVSNIFSRWQEGDLLSHFLGGFSQIFLGVWYSALWGVIFWPAGVS